MTTSNLIQIDYNGKAMMVEAASDAQASYIRDLVAKIEARKVQAPKKVSRWNDPVKAHNQNVAKARTILATLDSGQMSKGAASTHIPSLIGWAGR